MRIPTREIDPPVVRGIPGISTRAELREFVVKHGSGTPEHNARIYDLWFAPGPRYLFRAVDRKFGLRDKIVCDIGCAYGSNLVSCQQGSYGIEIEPFEVAFARSLGLEVYERDLMHSDISDLPQAEAAWCSAILEHVEAPHMFLRKAHLLLKLGGLVVVFVPTIPIFPWLKRVPGIAPFVTAHEHGDHINAFSRETLQFTCERAGFKTLEVSSFFPGPLAALGKLPIARHIVDGCVYVGQKIDDWEYPKVSTRKVAKNTLGFDFRGQSNPGGV